MDTPTSGISPLRQRMIEDMRMRKFGEKTQYQYLTQHLLGTDRSASSCLKS